MPVICSISATVELFQSEIINRIFAVRYPVLSICPHAKGKWRKSIYGTLTSVSPMRKGRKQNYFEGTVSNGTSKLRLVGFVPKVQRELNDIFSNREPIEIENCQIKNSFRGDAMEILLKSDTMVHVTTRDMIPPPDVDFEECLGRNDAFIKSAKKKYEFARVSIQAKTIRVGELETVRTGKQKQDVVIADPTDTITVTLWEENVGRLEVGKSYHLGNFIVREWGGTKYLAMYAESTIELVNDNYAERCKHLSE